MRLWNRFVFPLENIMAYRFQMEAVNASLEDQGKKRISNNELHCLEQTSKVLEPFDRFTNEVRIFLICHLNYYLLAVTRGQHNKWSIVLSTRSEKSSRKVGYLVFMSCIHILEPITVSSEMKRVPLVISLSTSWWIFLRNGIISLRTKTFSRLPSLIRQRYLISKTRLIGRISLRDSMVRSKYCISMFLSYYSDTSSTSATAPVPTVSAAMSNRRFVKIIYLIYE